MKEKQIIDNIDRNQIVEILGNLVRINSVNPPGNERKVVDKIIEYLPKNISYKIIDHGNNRASLIVDYPGNSEEYLAFVGHIDTVPVSDSEYWDHNPHEGKLVDGYIYGRGSADMKGGVSAMIGTLLYLNSFNIEPPIGIRFLFTADEESDGMGIKEIVKQKYFDDVVEFIIPEPSNEKIGLSEKGALWVKLKVSGKESHASKPNLGINAIEYAMTIIDKLKDSIDFKIMDHRLGNTTFSLTSFNGGVKTNIIPSNAEATLDIRTVPGVYHDEIIQELDSIIRDVVELEQELSVDVSIINNRPAIKIEKEEKLISGLVKSFKDIGLEADYKGINFYTDASQIVPIINIPFAILGPGDEEMAHQRNEKIEIESVARMIAVYVKYIQNKGG